MSQISRRNFLKLVGAAAPTILFPAVSSWVAESLNQGDSSKPNVIILLFDAMSARNLSVYGYPRSTSPNFERFADHATAYHSHYAGGNYTVPGTASLLTEPIHGQAGHSTIAAASNTVDREEYISCFGDDYHRSCFPQSMMANFIVSQFQTDIDTLISKCLLNELPVERLFSKDKTWHCIG
jgi:membrane-anchored protein YejM (alkaline phosphatase superfamily)